MIAIIDYGVGNLFSLQRSLETVGYDAVVTGEAEIIRAADKLILPGVGAFADAIAKLEQSRLREVIVTQVQEGKDILGICLGMQLLFEKSYEYGEHRGLGLLHGEVIPMESRIPKEYKIPHIGWNLLHIEKESKLLRYVKEGDYVYFVHSYFAANCEDSVAATTEYGCPMTVAVEKGNIYGCQFHPEKSGKIGLAILKAFCE